MRPFLHAALAFVFAVVLAWVCAMMVYVLGSEIDWWRDRDGGLAMGFAFTIGPGAGTIAGIIAAIWAFRRARRTQPTAMEGAENAKSDWPWPLRATVAASLFGGAAYLVGILVFWLFFPYRGSSFDPMGQIFWHAPAVMGVTAAVLGAARAARG